MKIKQDKRCTLPPRTVVKEAKIYLKITEICRTLAGFPVNLQLNATSVLTDYLENELAERRFFHPITCQSLEFARCQRRKMKLFRNKHTKWFQCKREKKLPLLCKFGVRSVMQLFCLQKPWKPGSDTGLNGF